MEKYLVLWTFVEETDSLGMRLADWQAARSRRDFWELCNTPNDAWARVAELQAGGARNVTVLRVDRVVPERESS